MHVLVRRPPWAAVLVSLVLLSACDGEAPPPPFLEYLPTTTEAVSLVVEGITEAGATVALTRSPDFGEGEEAPASVAADPVSGRFRFEVPLALNAENTLSVTSTDAADNTSEPAVVVVTQEVLPPSPPFLEQLPAFTTALSLDVEGTAQPGATVAVTRDPAFSDAEAPAAQVADPFTGRFRLTVPLAPETSNALAFVATHVLGGSSEASGVTIDQVPVRADGLTLSLGRSVISADEASIPVVVEVANDDPAADLAGLEVTVSVTAYPAGVADLVLVTNASGIAEGVVTGLDVAGTGTLLATAALPDRAGAFASDQRSFSVDPGLPALAALTLNDGASSANPLTTLPGSDIDVEVEVTDAAGNTLGAPQISVSTNAPGALVAGTQISGVTVAGSWDVWASIEGGALLVEGLLHVQPGPAVGISIELSPAEATAGSDLWITASSRDSFGNVASEAPTLDHDLPIWHAGLPDEDPQALLDVMATGGVTVARLVPLTAGDFTLSASLASGPTGSADLSVVPADAAAFDLELDLAGPFAAGGVIPFTATSVDAYGNPRAEALVVTLNAPGTSVAVDAAGHGEILDLVTSGSYELRARIPGTALEDIETVVVEADPSRGFNLQVGSVLTVEGGRVLLHFVDAYGNPIDIADVTVLIDGVDVSLHPSVSLSGTELLFALPGTFAVTAQLTADPGISDTELVAVQGVVDTLPPSGVATVTYPTGTDVGLKSHLQVQVAFTDNRALAEGEVIVQFGGVVSCTRTSGTLLLGGATSQTVDVALPVPNCAAPLDDISVVARAVDQAGNVGYTPVVTGLRVAPLPGFDVTATTGYQSSVVAFGNRLDVQDRPTDLAVEGAAGVTFVTLENRDRVVVTFPDRTQEDLRDVFQNRVDVPQPEAIARASTGELFISSLGSQSIYLYDAGLQVQPNHINFGNNPGRITYDETGPAPLLCVAFPGNGEARCYRNAIQNPASAGIRTGLGTVRSVSLRASRLWLVRAGCEVAYTDLTYDLAAPANPTVSFGGVVEVTDVGNDCVDLVALASGAVAVAHRGGSEVVRVDELGATEIVATGFANLQGLAEDGGVLFVLDRDLQAVFAVTGPL